MTHASDTQRSRRSRGVTGLWFLALVAVGLAAIHVLGAERHLTLHALKAAREDLLAFASTHYWTLAALWAAGYAAASALGMPGSVALSLATGFLFGQWLGAGLIILAAPAGATLLFLAARHTLFDSLQQRLVPNSLARRLLDGFGANGFVHLLSLRMVPLSPFWSVSLVAALTPMRLRTFVLATAVGVIPGSIVLAGLGESLGQLTSLAQLVSAEFILALALWGMLALLPILVKAWVPSRGRHIGREDRLRLSGSWRTRDVPGSPCASPLEASARPCPGQ